MTRVAVALREGVRLARRSPLRSAVIAGTIATATLLGMVQTSLSAGYWGLSVAVIVVARRSPRAEHLDSARASRRVGAGRFWIWLAGTVEALLLGVVPALVGAVIAIGLTMASGSGSSRTGGPFMAWQLAALAGAACLPTTRGGPGGRHALERRVRLAMRVAGAAGALVLMFGAARTIRTDLDLSLTGFVIVLLLVIFGVLLSGPLADWLTRAAGRLRVRRASVAIAARHHAPGTVRLVIVVAVSLATATTILGASIEARPDTVHVVDAKLARLPVLPADTALLQLGPKGIAAFAPPRTWPAFDPRELAALRTAVRRTVPGAELIALHDLGSDITAQGTPCFCPSVPVIEEEPRLAVIYGRAPTFPAPVGPEGANGSLLGTAALLEHASTRVPSYDQMYRALLHNQAVPRASFSDAVFYEVPPRFASGHALPVRSVFVHAPSPLTADQLRQLTKIAHAFGATGGTVSLIGPRGQLAPTSELDNRPQVSGTLREGPWAATSVATRWSITLVASLFAIAALLLTLTIDTIDRRRDVRRLERIGATPGQVRSGAALHSAATFAAVTWLDIIVVSALVFVGTRAFNHAEPDIPVPFAMPWPIIAALAIGLPVAAAALAALIARPVPLRSTRT